MRREAGLIAGRPLVDRVRKKNKLCNGCKHEGEVMTSFLQWRLPLVPEFHGANVGSEHFLKCDVGVVGCHYAQEPVWQYSRALKTCRSDSVKLWGTFSTPPFMHMALPLSEWKSTMSARTRRCVPRLSPARCADRGIAGTNACETPAH